MRPADSEVKLSLTLYDLFILAFVRIKIYSKIMNPTKK